MSRSPICGGAAWVWRWPPKLNGYPGPTHVLELADRLFAEKRMTRTELNDATARIGIAQGELRAAHLRYHIEMVDILTPAQIASYDELRGYGGGEPQERQQ
jgi:hypothetical protein